METLFVTTFQTREYTDKCFTGLMIQTYVCNPLDTNNSAENSQSSFTPITWVSSLFRPLLVSTIAGAKYRDKIFKNLQRRQGPNSDEGTGGWRR